MLCRSLLSTLLLSVLLLSLTQAGHRRAKKYFVDYGRPVIMECERRPKLYLCTRHCEADRDCQANNICCLTFCGNVCMNLLEIDRSVMPIAPPESVYPEDQPFSEATFEGDGTLTMATDMPERTPPSYLSEPTVPVK